MSHSGLGKGWAGGAVGVVGGMWLALCAATAVRAETTPASEATQQTAKPLSFDGHGTRWPVRILIHGATEGGARTAVDAALNEVKRIDALLSEWTPESDIGRINRAAGQGPTPVAHDTLAVLTRGLEVSQEANGGFALTVGALSSLWDFRSGVDVRTLPGPDRLRERLTLVDDRKVVVDRQASTASLATPGMVVTATGLSRAYAVDRVLVVLRSHNLLHALVSVGGDVGVAGAKGNVPWLLGIQDPRAKGYFAVVGVQDEAMSTCGDYQQFFEVDGKRYHHLLDPRSGLPATGMRSVTVLAKDTLTAAAYAEAVFVLGPEAGLKLVETHSELGAVLVDAENNVSVSSRLRERVRIIRAPTE